MKHTLKRLRHFWIPIFSAVVLWISSSAVASDIATENSQDSILSKSGHPCPCDREPGPGIGIIKVIVDLLAPRCGLI